MLDEVNNILVCLPEFQAAPPFWLSFESSKVSQYVKKFCILSKIIPNSWQSVFQGKYTLYW